MSKTVYREGDKIRSSDGMGYADSVDDATIASHIRLSTNTAEWTAFAEAVLAIRKYERLSVPRVAR